METFIKKPHDVKETYTPNQSQDKMFNEQIDLLYKNIFISVPASLLCATIVFIALYRIPHTISLIYWFISMVLISLGRLALSGLYIRHNYRTKSQYTLFLIMTAVAAGVWGFAGSFLMPYDQHIEQMIVIIVIAGVAAGGVQSLQSSVVACLIYTIVLIFPLACWIFLRNEASYNILGISVLLYLFFNISIALRGYHFLKHTLNLKYENIDLAEDVSRTNIQLNQLNQDLIDKENNLRLIHDNAPIGMAIVSLDGKWLNVNNKLCEIVGYSKDELERLTIQDVTYKDDIEIDLDNKTKLLTGKLQSYEIEKRYINKNDKLIWIVTNVSLVRGKGDKPLYYISQIQDINDRKQNELVIYWLSKMNSMLQLCQDSLEAYPIIAHTASEIFMGLSGGLSIFNKLTNEQETVGQWGKNPLLKSLFKSEDCWAFRSGNAYIVNDKNSGATCRHFASPPPGSYTCIPLIVQSQVLGMLNFTAPEGSKITHYQQQIINNFSEVIKLSLANIQLKEALSDQAIHDPLTGLLNRRYLYDVLPQILLHAIRTQNILSVCMVDVDFFKRVNDVYGHDAGDVALKHIGTILKNNLRESDIVCRFGGEEFVVILIGSDLQNAISQMEHIRLEIKNTKIHVQNKILPPVTISIGIAEAPKQGETVNEILHSADLALYAAKEAGRDRIVSAEVTHSTNC